MGETVSPLPPRPHHVGRPATHTFCPSTLPLISQLGLWHAPALFCAGETIGLMGVSSFDPPIPGSTRGRGFKEMEMSNFSRFVPFSKQLSSFSVRVGALEVIREPAGRLSKPNTLEQISSQNQFSNRRGVCCD